MEGPGEILVLEDGADDFASIRDAFQAAGFAHAVIQARTAVDALCRMTDGAIRPVLILFDLTKPNLDGRRFLDDIKSHPVHRQIPVVVLIAPGDRAGVKECYALGANTLISKPNDQDGLYAAIRKLKEYWFDIALLPPERDNG